jgi:hypothetical protein
MAQIGTWKEGKADLLVRHVAKQALRVPSYEFKAAAT